MFSCQVTNYHKLTTTVHPYPWSLHLTLGGLCYLCQLHPCTLLSSYSPSCLTKELHYF